MLEAFIFSTISPLAPASNVPLMMISQVIATIEQSQLLSPPMPQTIHASLQDTVPIAKSVLRLERSGVSTNSATNSTIAPPTDWTTIAIAPGVTAYRPTADGEIHGEIHGEIYGDDRAIATSDLVWQPQSEVVKGDGVRWQSGLDGTRHPYLSEVSLAQLQAHEIAPGRYLWFTTWEGEGYDRHYESESESESKLAQEPDHYLVSQREQGNDIHVSILYDATVNDPNQPNLIISIESEQDLTAQYTNISAFLIDPKTGAAIERRDFEQLPPVYDITLTKNGGFAGTETQECDRRCTISFVDRVTPAELAQIFPLKIQADNQAFAQRQRELAELRSQGWLIKEVPAPGR